MDTADHPVSIATIGQCTRCKDFLAWSVLQPQVHRERILILCPSCRMDRQSVCCEGESER